MPYALITEQQAANLRTARAANDKAAKKRVWTSIRADFGVVIPSDAKLGVEIDDTNSPVYRALYVKGTDPHQYLQVAPSTAPVASGQFVTITPPSGKDWACISRSALLQLLRDDTDDLVDYAPTLPAGFPTPSSEDALVLDSATGTLYFRS